MKKHKTLIAFIVLILLLAGFIALAHSTKILFPKEQAYRRELKVSGIVNAIRRADEQLTLMDSEVTEKTDASTDLMVCAMSRFVTENGYDGPDVFDNGIIVRTENGQIIYPETTSIRFAELSGPEDLDTVAPLTETMISAADKEEQTVLLSVKPISDGLYYLEWTKPEEYQTNNDDRAYLAEAVRALEKSYNAGLVLAADTDGDAKVIYHTEQLGPMETLSDIGISGTDPVSEPSEIKISDQVYTADYESLTFRGQPVKAIVLSGRTDNSSYIYNCITIAGGFTLLCMTGLILWIHWIEAYITDHTLTEEQEKAYHPSKIRKTFAAIGLTGAILLFLIIIGYQLMGNLSKTSAGNQEMLDIIMARLEDESQRNTLEKDEAEAREISYAKRVAELYGTYPELRNREFLSKAAELIGCEFIMIFDGGGKELLSSNAYVGFTLGKELSSTESFRFLLQGVEQIILDPEEEPFTGRMIQLAGIRIGTAGARDYEAMVLSFDLDESHSGSDAQEIAGYINMLTPQGYLTLIIGQEYSRIVYSSNSDYVGSTPKEIGLEETDLIPTSLEPFEILKRKTYGAFNENESYRCYYIMDSEKIWGDTVLYAGASALAFLIISAVLSLILLGPAHVDFYKNSAQMKEMLTRRPSIRTDKKTLEQRTGEFMNLFRDEEPGEKSLKEWWRDMVPEKKIVRLMSLLVTVIQAAIIAILIVRDETGSDSVIGFILTGSWKRGMNDLALMSIFCVIFILAAFILLKSWLLRLLCSILNAKGETIARLISSLLQYLSIITAICICLSYLGFDTGTLITSAGILTLAISLGSKDLVADILSGIFIIFEGDFHVGDIIEVNGFKGKVLDIGVRSTKLRDSGNNIKIIDNQSVKNVLNLSRENSLIYLTLTLSSTQPLDEIEAMLERELPDLREKVPTLINGPYYFGIDTIGYRRISITFGAETRQSEAARSRSLLNHALWELFTKHGIQL